MPNRLSASEKLKTTIDDIVCVNEFLSDFWGDGGWASGEAARLLRESRLDWQVDLSRTLRIWLNTSKEDQSDGCLILAWANLGALVEGTMKWFLCVFEHNYSDAPALTRNGLRIDPDNLFFAKLCDYFADRVWIDSQKKQFHGWCHTIRKRRNTIHAYANNQIGNWDEWQQSVEMYLRFLVDLGFQAPYPDEEFATPYKVTQVVQRVTSLEEAAE